MTTPTPKKRLSTGPIPDSVSLVEMYNMGSRLARTATANAWGLIGGIFGYLGGSVWAHLDKTPFFSRWELFAVSYTTAIAIYTLLSRSRIGVKRCLGFAELMFIDEQVTAAEYKLLRANCLRRSGLIGPQ
jgi:hypothetical protein